MKCTKISILISEPWDFGEEMGWRPLQGELLSYELDNRGGRALIELEEPIHYRGAMWRYVVASPRHEGSEIVELHVGKKVFCAMTGISEDRAKSANSLGMV